MKSISFLALVLLSTSTFAAEITQRIDPAQESETSANATSLRFLGGLGFSTLSTSDDKAAFGDSALKSRTGFNMGIEMDLPFSESFSFSTGINYVQKGISLDLGTLNSNPPTSMSMTLNFDYLEIPLMMNGNVQIGSSKLGLGVGPYAALAVSRSFSASVTTGGQTVDVSNQLSSEQNNAISKNTSAFDLGGRASMRFDTPLSDDLSFVVGANYDLGLINILKSNTENSTAKTRSFTANVGLGIKL